MESVFGLLEKLGRGARQQVLKPHLKGLIQFGPAGRRNTQGHGTRQQQWVRKKANRNDESMQRMHERRRASQEVGRV